jgi:hypothetical protein
MAGRSEPAQRGREARSRAWRIGAIGSFDLSSSELLLVNPMEVDPARRIGLSGSPELDR